MRLGLRQAIRLLFSGRAAVLALREWLYHWLLRKPDVLFRHLLDVGYPTDAGDSTLVIYLDSEADRARFHKALCYAIDMALRETDAATGD
jgi:hypothetical protein